MTTQKPYIHLYDSTLRDGAQTSTVNLSLHDKHEISKMLDRLGVDYIEGGWPGANPIDDEFFSNLPKLTKSKFTAFGMTRRANCSAANDTGLNAIINSEARSICIVGKSWDFHLKHAIKVSEEENLAMISDSIKHIIACGKEAFFDAEHFFDGYKNNPQFALKVAKCAFEAGARWVILCDTNGGTMPSEIFQIVTEITKIIPGENLGIHCHNDTGNAVANSLAAVQAGARQVQGTINGLGERCGNANLISLIPNLILKLNYQTAISEKDLDGLTRISREFDDLLNHERDDFAPYVGKYAFAHKGGLHVSAIEKNSKSYEHVDPSIVGNQRIIVISDQAGRSNIIARLREFGINPDKEISNEQINQLLNEVKKLEAKGYSYDVADASFEILVRKVITGVPSFFHLISFRVLNELRYDAAGKEIKVVEAVVKVSVNGKTTISVAEGNGPINALDKALRKNLSRKFPELKNAFLTDYKVRIVNGIGMEDGHNSSGTKATTRVLIESKDKKGNKWTTIGVSCNIVDASFYALKDSIIYHLLKHQNNPKG